jgi:hypothetical protein
MVWFRFKKIFTTESQRAQRVFILKLLVTKDIVIWSI